MRRRFIKATCDRRYEVITRKASGGNTQPLSFTRHELQRVLTDGGLSATEIQRALFEIALTGDAEADLKD